MSEKKIDVLVDPKKRFYCDDYKDRKGCDLELKPIKNEETGRTTMCNPVQLPCLDRDGNTVWVYVPHWISCPEQFDYFLSFMRKQAQKQAEWAASKRAERESGDREEESFSRRGRARRASAEY